MSVSADVYRSRRESLMALHPEGLILVRGAGAGGVSSNFFYLTGLEEPRATLLLAPRGVRIGTGHRFPGPNYVHGRMVRQLLLLPESDAVARAWGEDGVATVDGVSPPDAGVDGVLAAAELHPLLGRELGRAGKLQVVRGAPATLAGPDDPDSRFVARVRNRFFGLEIQDVTAAVHEARKIKQPVEIAAIRGAVALTGEALDAAVARIAPGVHEYEIEAEITRCYRAKRATHAFAPIVAAGGNAALPHYQRNTARLEAGQLVLIDTGASLDGYKGDVTRTFPVGGKFTARQRAVYEAVLVAQREAISVCRPGALLGDVHAKAWEAVDAAGFGAFFIHGTSHHLGLETHDVGEVHAPLAPGAVITVEPGVYLPDEETGVRIEDDVLITEDGPEVLSRHIPSSVEAIEERMR